MNTKKNIYKFIRFLFYCLGFPSMCLATLWLLSPMFTQSVMGDYPKICAIVPFAIWGIVELIHLALNKLAKKGAVKKDLATFLLVLCSTIVIVVPTAISDAALEKQYKQLQKEASTPAEPTIVKFINPVTNKEESLTFTRVDSVTGESETVNGIVTYNGVWLPEYKKVMGWATDSTNKNSSWYNSFISDVNSYISKWGLAGLHGSCKYHHETHNVDYDINYDGVVDKNDIEDIGRVRGLYDHIEFIQGAKLRYTVLAAQLNAQLKSLVDNKPVLQAEIDKAREEYEAASGTDKEEKNKKLQILLATQTSRNSMISELKGQTIRLYDNDVRLLVSLLLKNDLKIPIDVAEDDEKYKDMPDIDPTKKGKQVLVSVPGLDDILYGENGEDFDITIIGLTLPVKKLLTTILEIIDGVDNLSSGQIVELVINEVFKTAETDASGKYLEIETGLAAGNQYHKCAAAAQKFVDDKSSYSDVKLLEYKLSIYPQLFAFARLKRILYIFAGLVIISLLVSDHYTRKINQINKIQFNDRVKQIIIEKGYNIQPTPAVETATPIEEEVNTNLNLDLNNNTSSVNTINENTTNVEPVPIDDEKPIKEETEKTAYPQGIDLTLGGKKNER